MSTCSICPFCSQPGTFESATEKRRIRSNVRAFREDYFTLWRCTGCESLHSLEDADLGRYYAQYPFKDHRLNFHMRCAYRNRVTSLRRLGVARNATILDYGCGAGLYVDFLRDRGFSEAAGYDPYIPRFADPRTLERHYDVVVSHDVIEHVDDAVTYLRTLARLVRPEGLLIIGTPNAEELTLEFQGVAPPELSQPYHRHIFSERALCMLAAREGFVPRAVSHRFYFDTVVPTVNTRFMWSYIESKGGFIDAAVEPPDAKFIFSSPRLLWHAVFGYLHRMPGNMVLALENRGVAQRADEEPVQQAIGA